MDQYLLIPFLGEWTSIYQLFWCSPGVQGFWHTAIFFHGKALTHQPSSTYQSALRRILMVKWNSSFCWFKPPGLILMQLRQPQPILPCKKMFRWLVYCSIYSRDFRGSHPTEQPPNTPLTTHQFGTCTSTKTRRRSGSKRFRKEFNLKFSEDPFSCMAGMAECGDFGDFGSVGLQFWLLR